VTASPLDRPDGSGRPFWLGLVVGWSAIAYGGWIVLTNVRETRPVNLAAFLLGGLLVHDLIVAPATIAVAAWIRPRLPRVARGAVAGAAATSAVLIALVVPAGIGRAAKVAGNPSIVPRDPVVGAAIAVALVWLVAGVVIVRRLRTADRAPTPEAAR
jgi:hypothetical protein